MVKREVDAGKREVADKEDQYQQQIRQLKKIVHEKETVENVVTGRVEKVRQEKDEEIGRLGKLLNRQKEEHTIAMQ